MHLSKSRHEHVVDPWQGEELSKSCQNICQDICQKSCQKISSKKSQNKHQKKLSEWPKLQFAQTFEAEQSAILKFNLWPITEAKADCWI